MDGEEDESMVSLSKETLSMRLPKLVREYMDAAMHTSACTTPLIPPQEDTFQDYMYSDRGMAAAYDLDMDVMDTSMDGAELGDSVEP